MAGSLVLGVLLTLISALALGLVGLHCYPIYALNLRVVVYDLRSSPVVLMCNTGSFIWPLIPRPFGSCFAKEGIQTR